MRHIRLCVLAAAGTLLGWSAQAQTSVPLELYNQPSGFQRLIIFVGIAGGAPQPYLFDTGSNNFNAAYNPLWYPAPTSTLATGAVYTYGSGAGYLVNQVIEPYLSFYAPGNTATPVYQTPSANYTIGQVTNHLLPSGTGPVLATFNGSPFYNDPTFAALVAANQPPLEGALYGTFGAGDFAGTLGGQPSGSVLGQIQDVGGYVVAANSGASGDSAIQSATSCAPQCVTIGLNAAVRALFTNLVPWSATGPAYPNSGTVGSTEFGATYTVTLTGPNGAQPITFTSSGLLDTGTQNVNLRTTDQSLYNQMVAAGYIDSNGNLITGTIVSVSGNGGGAIPIDINNAAVNKTFTGSVSLASNNNTIGLPLYQVDSVMYDLANQLVAYTPYFISADNFSTSLTIDGSSSPVGLAGTISGPGTLTVGNGGNVMLSGTNSYTGATAIAAGGYLAMAGPGSIAASSGVIDNGVFDLSLACAGYDGGAATCGNVAIADLSGAGRVYLGAQNLVLTNASGNFSGVISDTGNGAQLAGSGGSLTVAGGTATLSGVNTYTGSTSILAGARLALSGAGSIAASSGLADAGVFDISAATQGATIAALGGTGQVNLGAQALTIANANGSFSGTIADGGLAGGAGGRLVVAGGTQVLTGANSYTGGTTVTGGATLAVNGDAALGAATAPLTLDNGTLLALADLTSTRPVTIAAGGGTINAGIYQVSLGGPLTLNGAFATIGNVQFGGTGVINGGVTVSGGKLAVDGDLSATGVTVSSDGILRGTGTVRAPVTVYGTLAPGDSPGTLTFTSAVRLDARATTEIDVDGPGTGKGGGNYSRIVVVAPATITLGGTLAPKLRGITGSATNVYVPPLGQVFNIVSASGGIIGSYAGLTQPAGLAANTRFDLLYAPGALDLVVTPAAYASLGIDNQAATGAALDAIRPAAGLAMSASQAALFRPLYQLPGAAIPAVLDSLSPEIVADDLLVRRDAWNMVGNTIEAEMQARRGARPQDGQQSAPLATGTVWMSAMGQFASVDSHGVPGYGSTMGGGAAGIDLPALPWLTAGVALGWTSPTAQNGSGAHLAGDALQAVAYGSLHQGRAFLDVQAGGGFSETDYYRPLPLYGVQAQGTAHGTAAGASAQAGLHLDGLGWQVEPSLTLGGVSLRQGSFAETTGAPEALAVAGQGLASVQTLLGARLERRFGFDGGYSVVPTAQLGWLHEYADTRAASTASFQAAPGTPFTVQSAPIGRDSAVLGLGAALDSGGPWSVFASYTTALNARSTAQNLTGGLRVTW